MPDTADTQFLREGIDRYEQALDTIAAFETMLGDKLREIAKGYSCKSFTPTNAKIETKPGKGPAGRWIWAGQQGRLRSKGLVWLELGVWWNEGKVAYYCNFCDDNNHPIEFTYKRKRSGVEFKMWSKTARLFMLRTKERRDAMDEDFRILLDELTSSFS